MFKSGWLAAAAVVVTLAVPLSSQAVPISGTIDFTGVVTLVGGTDFSTRTGVVFFNPADALLGTGDYGAIPDGTDTFYTNFTFEPAMVPSPVAPLWTLTFAGLDYSFDMINVVNEYNTTFTSLTLGGNGILKITGFEDTPGLWTFTTQDNGRARMSFSASSTVPEPGTMLLLGTGLLGLGLMRRKKQARS